MCSDDVAKAVRGSFDLIVTCVSCGSQNVRIKFYEGFVHDCGGDTGGLTITCHACKSETEL